MTIRIISDVHGKVDEYLNIVNDCDYSIQVGDMWNYSFVDKIDPDKHKFFFGNHDNWDLANAIQLGECEFPHWMGKYGEFELNGIKGFFISGAFSIDWRHRIQDELRTGHKSWWTNEQLSMIELADAVALYKSVKPDLFLSHSTPVDWSRKFGSKKILASYGYDPKTFTTNTQEALQECVRYHAPKLHIFGHFHMWKNNVWRNTRYVCQRELGWVDIDSNLNIIKKSS